MALLPKETCNFLENLYDHLYARDLEKARRLYEVDFHTVTDLHYSNTNWPRLSQAKQFYSSKNKEHQLIFILYQELYFRHAFTRVIDSVRWADRALSFENYSFLFEFFLKECTSDENAVLIPAQWLWDMFDQFVYQFSDTQRRKWKLLHSIVLGQGQECTDDESESLAELFDPRFVLNVLYQFVATTGINEVLKANKGTLPESCGLKEQLGYFALISLLRLNNLFCDYSHALHCVKNVALGPNVYSARLPNCHAVLHYNVAFAKLMCRNYCEATKAASYVLGGPTKSKHYMASLNSHTKERVDRYMDQLYLLVILTDYLSPLVKVDEFIMSKIRESYRDKLSGKFANSDQEFHDHFKKICPKFVSAAIWDQKLSLDIVQMQQPADLLNRQISVFSQDLTNAKRVDQLMSFATLYNNVSLTKLGALMNMAAKGEENLEERIREELLFVYGTFESSPVDFLIDDDRVNVTPQKPNDLFVDQYLKQIHRLQDLIFAVQAIEPGPPTGPLRTNASHSGDTFPSNERSWGPLETAS